MLSKSKELVVSGHREATKAGIEILNKGGNAIDAAIAASMALPPLFNIDTASRELKG